MKRKFTLLMSLLVLALVAAPAWAKKKESAAAPQAAEDQAAKEAAKAAKAQQKAEAKAAKAEAKAAEKKAKEEAKAAEEAKKEQAKAAKVEPEEAVEVAGSYEGLKWEYKAKRMSPPKSKKWMGRWNSMGQEGWELAGQMENLYIFKRPVEGSGKRGHSSTSESQSF